MIRLKRMALGLIVIGLVLVFVAHSMKQATYSKRQGVRFELATSNQLNWPIVSFNIRDAFHEIEREEHRAGALAVIGILLRLSGGMLFGTLTIIDQQRQKPGEPSE